MSNVVKFDHLFNATEDVETTTKANKEQATRQAKAKANPRVLNEAPDAGNVCSLKWTVSDEKITFIASERIPGDDANRKRHFTAEGISMKELNAYLKEYAPEFDMTPRQTDHVRARDGMPYSVYKVWNDR